LGAAGVLTLVWPVLAFAQAPDAPVPVFVPTAVAVPAQLPAQLSAQQFAQVQGQAPAVPAANLATTSGTGQTLNFKDADIREFIAAVSDITGRAFIVDPRVEGRVNVISARPMDGNEIYQVFESVLRVHGFATVAAGNMIKIVPEALAKQDGSAAVQVTGPDTLVTKLIPLRFVSAQELVPILTQLVPQSGQVSVHQGSNSLLITDRAGNLARIESIIRRIDQASDASVEVIALQHANASELARTIALLDEGKTSVLGTGPTTAKVLADTRTNSLLVSGDRAARLRTRALVSHLDTPLDSGESTQVVYLRYANAKELVPILEATAATLAGDSGAKEQARKSTVQAHEETNAVVITADPAVYRALVAVIRQLDIRRAQVLIEGIIAEIGDDRSRDIGVQFQATDINVQTDGTLGSGVIGGTNLPRAGGAGSIIGAAVNPLSIGTGLNIGYVRGTITLPGSDVPILDLGALISALESDGRSTVLSTPNLVTLDHQEAEIKVGQKVPFLTGSFTNTSTGGGAGQPTNPFQTIEREDVGLKLKVTPHINEGDSVRLDLVQEVSSLAPSPAGAVDLVTNNREITTSVLVPDRVTLVLGGLISDETRESISQVPFLGDIPVLGNLFRYRNTSRNRRNLMVFLKPTILRDAYLEQAVSSEKYNFIRTEQLKRREEDGRRGRDNSILPELVQPPLPADPPPEGASIGPAGDGTRIARGRIDATRMPAPVTLAPTDGPSVPRP